MLLVFVVVVVLASVWVHMAMALAMSIALANAMACNKRDCSSGVVVMGVAGVASIVCSQFSKQIEEGSRAFVVAAMVWLLRAEVPPRGRPIGLRVGL